MELMGIWHYPVKSCIGNALTVADVDESGIGADRLFVIATPEGKPLTQRSIPRLNLISVTITPRHLCLQASGWSDLSVDLRTNGTATTVELYDGPAPGECMGTQAAHWLTEFVGRPCQLVRSHQKFVRRPSPQAAHLFLPEQKRFPDCAPILLIGCASLNDLNARLNEPVEMSRFRPNMVIEGAPPYAEDSWLTIRVGEVLFDYMGPCERCGITLIAPGTDMRGKEPLRTLRTYRITPQGLAGGIVFGVFFKPRQPAQIRIGDRVEVLKFGNPPALTREETS